MTIQRKQVDWHLERLVKIIDDKKFFIEWSGAPNRPRLVYGDPYGTCRDVSPRLSRKEICDWINAFIEGIKYMKDDGIY